VNKKLKTSESLEFLKNQKKIDSIFDKRRFASVCISYD